VKSTVEPLEGNKVKVTVEVDEDEFERALDAAFRRIAREVRIPGFRPGKAPRRLLEARLGAGVGREEALRDSVPGYYAQAVREHDVDVIAAPTIDITSGEEAGAVAFDAVVEVRPQVDVAGYGGLRVTVPRPEASDEEIDAQVDRLREQFGELTEVTRPAAQGDHVTINMQGSQNGEPVAGLTADDYLYEVGSGGIATELDETLRGAKIGDVLEFDSDHPDPEQPAVHFRILVKDVKEKVLPDVTDEWANEVSEFDTVDELRADFAKRIGNVRRFQSAMALRERVAEALASLVEDDAPEPLVDEGVRERLQSLAMRLSSQGIEVADYLQAVGKSESELVDELRAASADGVKVDLALRAVADAEDIECTDEDLDAEFERLAERIREKPERVRREFERNDQVPAVRSDVRKRKALDWLIEHVEIVDEAGEPIDRADLEIGAGEPDGGDADATDEVDEEIGAEADSATEPTEETAQ
jgi:trigger factor